MFNKKTKKTILNKQSLFVYNKWLKERYTSRDDKENIYGVGITDAEFVYLTRILIFGEAD